VPQELVFDTRLKPSLQSEYLQATVEYFRDESRNKFQGLQSAVRMELIFTQLSANVIPHTPNAQVSPVSPADHLSYVFIKC